MISTYPVVKPLGIVFMCFFLTSCNSISEKGKDGVSWKEVNVLVYTKNGVGYVHDNIPSAVKCIQKLGRQYGFHVSVSDRSDVFSDNNLKKYTALVFTSTNNDVFDTDEQRVAFMRYIQSGGGFVGIHSVTGTERDWPWFSRLVGGLFERHAPHQSFQEIIIDTTNISTSFLPVRWEVNDECYYIKDINPDLRVLMVHNLSTVEDSDKPTIYNNVFPSTWCHTFDGGREWYTALGHDRQTYSDPVFAEFIMGGIKWVVDSNKPLDYSKAYAQHFDDPLPY